MKALPLTLLLALVACHSGSPSYTLYRNSPVDEHMRVHWATFDVPDQGVPPGTYNQENCELASDLLNANLKAMHNGGPVKVRFWCEKGGYRS